MESEPRKRKKIGLALSGGAARGFAHVGVIKVLAEHGIEVDYIAGTSAGAIVGAALAGGLDYRAIVEIGRKLTWFKVSGFPYSAQGLLSNAPMGDLLRELLPVDRFEDLKLPFAAVACQLGDGEPVILSENGDLPMAIRASCAIPGIFVPVEIDGKQLIDGGVVELVPVETVRRMGAEIVIAVDVNACGATYWATPSTFLGVFFQSTMTLLRTAGKSQHYRADVVIIPPIAHLRPDEISRMDEFVKLGEEATVAMIDQIKSVIND